MTDIQFFWLLYACIRCQVDSDYSLTERHPPTRYPLLRLPVSDTRQREGHQPTARQPAVYAILFRFAGDSEIPTPTPTPE